MNLLRKIITAVALRLSSFNNSIKTKTKLQHRNRFKKLAFVIIVFVLTISLSTPYFIPIITNAAQSSQNSGDFKQMNFEICPNADESEKTVSLDGLMPKNASAEAVDVTNDFCALGGSHEEDKVALTASNPALEILAAYDITINGGSGEYQPEADKPIKVEITDPQINVNSTTELWHIGDDGTREQIEDFTVENGKITFFAKGFSIYAIVSAPEPYETPQTDTVTQLSELTGANSSSGFYLYYGSGTEHYFTNSINSKNCLIETTDISNASVWYFEQDTNYYKIYTYVGNNKVYIHTKSGNEIELSSTADLIDISDAVTSGTFYFKKSDDSRWLQHSNGGGGIRYYTDNNNAENSNIKIRYADASAVPDDYYLLDGRTLGLMNYPGGTLGYAFMADEQSNSLEMMSLVVRSDNSSSTLYVAEDSDISMWTFHTAGADRYKISTELNGLTKYIHIGTSTVTLVDESQATEITVTPGNNKVRLSANGKSIALDDGEFVVQTSAVNDENQLFNFVEVSGIENDDFVTYSSEKIGVSDVLDGSSVIVYTRIWNNDTKAYEFYAVGHDGTLYPCYERGDYIMWVGSRINTLIWNFIEYHYDDGSPNYYYELYNPYSRKYIAPQITDGQILSDSKIGINLPGRREGEYYTDIVAWNDDHYTYAGLASDMNLNSIISTTRSNAETFYFAKVESPTATLTKVNTIDNSQYGITMKMIDFPVQPNKDTGEYYQNDFLGTNSESLGGVADQGLLTTDLKANGYPNVTSGASLAQLYSGATEANHLFIESVYKASGYFEFDSCQNFATLIQDDGTRGTNFNVYKELGTTENSSKSTLKHGQFFPYDTIQAGVYSTLNPENLYSALAIPGEEQTGLLPESDPRKYEKLHTVGRNPNYFNGMEMEASFVQTPSGKDTWGHDIIFEFTGDDDFWLYVDGELIIDLGGIHSALAGSVNFATGDVVVNGVRTTLRDLFESNYLTRNPGATQQQVDTFLADYFDEGETVFKDYSAHSMKIFYMERGAGASNLHMRFNLCYITPGQAMLTKVVTGTDNIDSNLVEYPFQIWYKDELYGDAHLLTNTSSQTNVNYQNSTQTVEYLAQYTPPNSNVTYDSVYFLHPSMNAQINFPTNTIEYRIVECGVNSAVYDEVIVNGTEVQPHAVGTSDRNYYDSGWMSITENPNTVFENHVYEDALRTISFTKILEDESGNIISAQQDSTTFSFRLYLSDGVDNTLRLANMYKYYVKDPDGYLCEWSSSLKTFVPTNKRNIDDLTDAEKEAYGYDTSMNGAISKIPAGFTVEVPYVPVGAEFKVEERDYEVPLGYSFERYDRAAGTYDTSAGDTLNSGWVRINESPHIDIYNARGWGLQANKVWSDKSYTTTHDSIFTAVYIGNNLVSGTVKQLTGSDTYVRYFFDELQSGTSFEDYEIYEVELTNPTFDNRGNLTGYDSVTRKLTNGELTVVNALPKNAQNMSPFSYEVEYDRGEIISTAAAVQQPGNVRTDTITNTRSGGLVITLYDMHTNQTLANGTFTLKEGNNTIGTFVADSQGRVTILYDFQRDTDYTLSETSPPDGYLGLPNTATFSIASDDEVTISGNSAQWQQGYKSETVGDNLIAYVDVYNPPYTLSAVKVDDSTDALLSGAHFALYRSVNGIGGSVKDINPMTGYEDLVTGADGLIPGIDNTLPPGTYYLSETSAPPDYEGLSRDIIFNISELGEISIVTTADNATLSQDGTSTISYLISVPNKKTTEATLTITKTVDGNFGDLNKEFDFTLTVAGAASGDEYRWSKNGVAQNDNLQSGDNFTLKHGDTVSIVLPKETDITIAENSLNYESKFKLADGQEQSVSQMTFELTQDTTLSVTNTLEGVIPTGVKNNAAIIAAFLFPALICIVIILVWWKKSKERKNSA